MTAFAIGDLQGCYKSFEKLLDKISFRPGKDELWLAGDLVNRGPRSLDCMRKARELNAKIVLGNHDLHMLACYYSKHSLKKKDTLAEVMSAPDVDDLMLWLRQQPLIYVDKSRKTVMTHAGIPHIWTLKQARSAASEVESVLKGDDAQALQQYFDQMYGNVPAGWKDGLSDQDRHRVITNYFTRMRFINSDGQLELTAKEGLERAPEGFQPWFSFPQQHKYRVIFGHWAAIEGYTGEEQFQAIDTGCVWGGRLTSLNLDTLERTSVAAQE